MKNLLFRKILILLVILFLTIPNTVYAIDFEKDLANLDIDLDSETGLVSINQYSGNNKPSQTEAWNTVYSEYKEILVGFSGILTLTFVVLFMKNTFALGQSSENPQEREKCLKGILWTGIGTGGFAIVTILMAMAFKFFQ